MFRQRIRVGYRVEGDKRFLSHHDMMRLWHRALRRSRLPLRTTEGFHVRPRVSFAMARGVGIASESEWLELELSDWVNPDTVTSQLASQLPPGITLRSLKVVASSDRAIVRRIAYAVSLSTVPEDIDRRIADFLNRDQAVVERGGATRRRRLDIRPLVAELSRSGSRIDLMAECRSDGSLRPEELLGELGLSRDDIARSLIMRVDSTVDSSSP